jgi:DNA-binding transcriptional LysR family regulator
MISFGIALSAAEDMAAPCVADGDSIRVLQDWGRPFAGYHLYYPCRRQHSAMFALLVDAVRYRDNELAR